jgi:hypothetical protein
MHLSMFFQMHDEADFGSGQPHLADDLVNRMSLASQP